MDRTELSVLHGMSRQYHRRHLQGWARYMFLIDSGKHTHGGMFWMIQASPVHLKIDTFLPTYLNMDKI
jgi:hypothetical protein